jgi:hypothetical protein
MTDHPRPLGLRLLIWLLWFWAGANLLLMAGIVFGEGPVLLGGEAVSRGEATARVLPIFGPMTLAAVGAALALLLNRPWARPAVLLPFALAALAPLFTGTAETVTGFLLTALAVTPVLAALTWYLYGHGPVNAYFRKLRGA